MSHRRPSRPTPAPSSRRAPSDATHVRRRVTPFGAEHLEQRRLLTTFAGAPAAGSTVPTPISGQFRFTDGAGDPSIITFNDVAFEAIGQTRGTATRAPQLVDLVPFPLPTVPSGIVGADIFKIYVAESSADSFITISHFVATNGNVTPFAGNVTAGVTNTGGVNRPDLPGLGGILIGGVDLGPGLTTPRPDLDIEQPLAVQFGFQPPPASGLLEAGIEVIPTNPLTGLQNDFGSFLVGGPVTGRVSFGGNLNVFYAGGIYTGNSTGGQLFGAAGGGAASASPSPGNFSVAGDLRELVTGGPLGTDGGILPALDGNPRQDPAIVDYVSNFDLNVGGTLGEMHVGNAEQFAGNAFAGTITVAHNPVVSGQAAPPAGVTSVTGLRTNQVELESTAVNAIGQGNEFAQGLLYFLNSTPADAQVLNSIPELNPNTGAVLRDVNGNELTYASVDGAVQGTPSGDTADYYAMALMAGTTHTVTLTDSGGSVQILDPDGRIIQSNAEANGGAIQFTADRPGIYRFEVNSPQATLADPYNLTITGTGDLSVGGIVVTGEYNDTGVDGGVALYAGDLGAIDVGGAYYSLTLGPTVVATAAQAPVFARSSIVVASGNLRAIVAGALGERLVGGNQAVLEFGPVYNIPAGGIGLAQTTDVMDFETQFDPNFLSLTTPQYVTNTAYARAISGSVQVIDAGTTLQALVGVDGGIGSIRAGNMATDLPSHIDVNADNLANDGIIDLLDVEGPMGTLAAGGPVLITNTNGDVRYMNVAGVIFLPSPGFGATVDEATELPIGAPTTLVDDSGTTVQMTPYGPTTTTVTTSAGVTTTTSNGSSGAPTTTPAAPGSTVRTVSTAPGQTQTIVTDALGNTTTTLVTGPQLSVLSYPVADKGGRIPIHVTSTGSMTITASGSNGAASSVDIGSVTIAGIGRPLVAVGVDRFGNVTITQPNPATTATTTTGGTGTGTSTGVGTGTTGGNAGTNTGTGTTTGGNAGSNTTGSSGGGTSIANGIAAGTVTSIQSLTSLAATDPSDLFLLIAGSATVNVLNVQSVQTVLGFVGTPGFDGAISTVTAPTLAAPIVVANRTGGELVNANFPNGIGTLQVRGNLGFAAAHATPAAVYTRPVLADGYPFVQQHTAIQIGGNAVNVLSNASIGNVIASGTIGNLVADFGNRPAPGVFAGITGPIQAGRLLFVEVGQGLTDSGTGGVGMSGLYATNKIGEVTNGGVPNGDIRGNIVVLNIGNTDQPAIDLIQLGNASIVGSNIYDLDGGAYLSIPGTIADAFSVSADVPDAAVRTAPLALSQPAGNPIAAGNASDADIRAVNVTGAGGILSSTLAGGSIGPITISRNGFGFLNSNLFANAAGRIFGITAGGYGIRGSDIDNGGYVGPITATGNGSLLPVTAFPIDLRPSDVTGAQFDPFTGNPISNLNDLNAALGGAVSAASPTVANVTDTGVIEDLVVSALFDVTGISAQKVRTALPLTSTNAAPLPALANIPVIGTPFADSITTGGNVGYVRVRSLIDGLQITAGSVGQFTQTGDVNRLGIDVAGSIASLTVHGNLGAIITDPATLAPARDSYIFANGLNSHIDRLTVYGNVYADIFSSKYIGAINIHGSLAGNVTIQGVSSRNLALTSLAVSGSIASGSLNIAGAVGTITTGGSLGVAGQALAIAGPVKKLVVGSPRTAAGTALALDLTIYGNVGQIVVNGRITGNVHILNNLQSLTVNGTAANPAVAGNITVEGAITRATVNNGDVASTVSAIGGIGTFTINRGSLLGLAAIESTLGSITTVRVLGGAPFGIAGSIIAANGQNLNVTTTGSVGDGTNPATLLALSGGTISIGGNVSANAAVTIAGPLDNLVVAGTVQAGGTVSGHPIKHVRIGTPPAGTVTAT